MQPTIFTVVQSKLPLVSGQSLRVDQTWMSPLAVLIMISNKFTLISALKTDNEPKKLWYIKFSIKLYKLQKVRHHALSSHCYLIQHHSRGVAAPQPAHHHNRQSTLMPNNDFKYMIKKMPSLCSDKGTVTDALVNRHCFDHFWGHRRWKIKPDSESFGSIFNSCSLVTICLSYTIQVIRKITVACDLFKVAQDQIALWSIQAWGTFYVSRHP